MSFQAFESDVPPLKVKCSPMPGSAKSSRSVQHTQKSFSTLKACNPILASTCWNASRRRSAGSLRKAFADHPQDQ